VTHQISFMRASCRASPLGNWSSHIPLGDAVAQQTSSSWKHETMQRRPIRNPRVEERKVRCVSTRVPLDTNASKPQIVQQPVCPLLKCRRFADVFGHLLTSFNSELLQDIRCCRSCPRYAPHRDSGDECHSANSRLALPSGYP